MLPVSPIMKSPKTSSAFSPLMVDTTSRGGLLALTNSSQGMLYHQPRPSTSPESFHTPPRILPACSPMFNSHYFHRYSVPEYSFIPLPWQSKEAALGAGGFMAHYGGFPSAMYHTPVEEEKPSQSYIGLIGKAILSSPQKKLVLSDIYNYVLSHYPYFRNKGPGWRNSIRHNLSLNECFLKVGRSPNGKGHFWAINPANLEDFSKGEYRRKRAQKRRKGSVSSEQVDDEAKSKCPDVSMSQKTNYERVSHEENKPLPREDKNSRVIQKVQNSSEKKGFHIETLLGNLKASCVPLKELVISRPQIKDSSAFSIVSKGMNPAQNTSAVVTSWSEQQCYSNHRDQIYGLQSFGLHHREQATA